MSDDSRPTLMAVDDVPANLDLLESIFTEERFTVLTLPNGPLALRAARAAPPDVILLDIKMPGMDGYQVCARLQEEPATRDIPVIFISALQDIEDKVLAFRMGGVDYVSKPFQPEEVVARVRTHLALRAARRAVEASNAELRAAQARLERTNRELTAARNQAEAANHAKTAFLANMSHELRTPLNAVLGFAQVLEADRDLSPPQRENVEQIHQGGTFLLDLINDVLDLAKIEAGRYESHPETWDPKAFFTELSGMFRMRAAQKGLFLEYQVDPSLPSSLVSDYRHLRQIVMNLLGNAVKFTHQGGVTLRATFGDERLRVEVADTGVGIAPADRTRIFEPFHQAGDPRQQSQGTGLGLAISQQLARVMGGTLALADTPGPGACFEVILPVRVTVEDPPRHAVAEGLATDYRRLDGREEPLRLLIVDDVPNNLKMFQRLLESIGFKGLVAESGEECLALAETTQPDAFLVDVYMPGIGGLETTRRLRAQSRFRDVPIITMSANVFAAESQRGEQAGANGHLAKPIFLPELTTLLGQWLPVEWIRANGGPATAPQGADGTKNLSLEQWRALDHAAREGNIAKLLGLIDPLRASGCCASLVGEIEKHIRAFNLSALKRLLRDQAREAP